MASFKVIGVDISSNSNSGILDVVIQRQISFFILEAAEPALNHDVVCPAAFSIHTHAACLRSATVGVLL